MKKQYSRKQILEAINYWQEQLKQMNESKSPLLDIFADEFGRTKVFSKSAIILTNNELSIIYKIFRQYFFRYNMPDIPIKCMEFNDLCKTLKHRYDYYKEPSDPIYINPPETIYGVHNVISMTDENNFKLGDEIKLLNNDIIIINKSKLANRSFSLWLSTICHEMIHYYDRLCGEYVNFYMAQILSKNESHFHKTPTFQRKMMEANKNYINVIESIPDGEQIDTVENNAVNMILKAFNEDESGKKYEIPRFDNMQQMGGKYIMLTTY